MAQITMILKQHRPPKSAEEMKCQNLRQRINKLHEGRKKILSRNLTVVTLRVLSLYDILFVAELFRVYEAFPRIIPGFISFRKN